MMAAAAAASGFTYPFMGPTPHSMASFFGKNAFNVKGMFRIFITKKN